METLKDNLVLDKKKNSKAIWEGFEGHAKTIGEFWMDFIEPRLPLKDTVIKWHQLLMEYIKEPRAVFAIRYYHTEAQGHRSLRYVHPFNYFLSPKKTCMKSSIKFKQNDIGEYDKVQKYVQDQFSKLYGSYYDYFLELVMPTTSLEPVFGNTEIDLYYNNKK